MLQVYLTLVVVLHSQYPIVEDDHIFQLILLFLKYTVTHLKKIDVSEEQEWILPHNEIDWVTHVFIPVTFVYQYHPLLHLKKIKMMFYPVTKPLNSTWTISLWANFCVAIKFSIWDECTTEPMNLHQNTHIGSASTSNIFIAPNLPATFRYKSNFHPYSWYLNIRFVS
jgi:hypothetical protein